jgi:hypothetical protein
VSDHAKVIAAESGDHDAFWSVHDPEKYKGGGFLDEAAVRSLIRERATLRVVEVGPEESTQYGLRRVVVFDLDGTEVRKSFTVNDKDGAPIFPGRAEMLADMAGYLSDGGEPIPVHFAEAGSVYALEPAS